MKKKILIIDDEEKIIDLLTLNLKTYGYEVHTHNTGEGAMEKIAEVEPDLVLLDLMLPVMNGVEICKRIRNDSAYDKMGLLIISAKSDQIDKVLCLELGADDYITKPFGIRELIARVGVCLRRIEIQGGEKPPVLREDGHIYRYKDLTIDTKSNKVYKGDKEIFLTIKEYELFLMLLKNQGNVVTREELIERCWKYNKSEARSLDVYIRKLRVKLEDTDNSYIDTVRGRGYLVP